MCNFECVFYGFLISSPVTGPEWPREFQEVKVSGIHDNSTGRC